MKTYKLFTYLLPVLLVTAQASQMSDKDLNNSNTQTRSEPKKKDLELQKGIQKYLPQFFRNNQQMLEKLQEGKRQAVVVIGQTGAGKSTLIGALLGHKFTLEEQKVTKTLKNGRKMSFEEDVIVNKTPNAPKIGLSEVESETVFPAAYLDKKHNLAFIDTAGLADTRKDGTAINICSAIGLRSLIEAIDGIQCIIGVISYNNFIEGKGSNAFFGLLCATSSMLNKSLEQEKQIDNKGFERCASSIVLAFTKVPENVKKKDITNKLKKQCFNFMEMKDKKQEHKLVEDAYKVLFPSYYDIKDKKDVPFFLISQESILKQGLVRKNMLPALQNTTKVDSKDIGLVLQPYLLQKTKDWLAKRAQSIANDIRDKENYAKKITQANEKYNSLTTVLSKQKNLLKQFTNPNNKDTKDKKEIFKKHLNDTIQTNTQELQQRDLTIKNKKKEALNKKTKIKTLDTNEVVLHTKISGSYDKSTKEYNYSHNDGIKINHIRYGNSVEYKNPTHGQSLDGNYKVNSITKNYDQGRLSITLKSSIHKGVWAFAGISTAITLGYGAIVAVPLLTAIKWAAPFGFYIYAQKKHIYHNDINILSKDIKNLEEDLFNDKNEQKRLEKEIKLCSFQLQQLQSNNLTKDQLKNNFGSDKLKQAASNLLQEEQMIEKTKTSINTKTQKIQEIKRDLQLFQRTENHLNNKISQSQIIPCIITHVAPFIDFDKGDQNNINTCIEYMNNLKQDNQNNNNLEDNTNTKHSDTQPGGELEERKDDDDYCDNNTNNNTSLFPSLVLGTSLLAGSLSKKKN